MIIRDERCGEEGAGVEEEGGNDVILSSPSLPPSQFLLGRFGEEGMTSFSFSPVIASSKTNTAQHLPTSTLHQTLQNKPKQDSSHPSSSLMVSGTIDKLLKEMLELAR